VVVGYVLLKLIDSTSFYLQHPNAGWNERRRHFTLLVIPDFVAASNSFQYSTSLVSLGNHICGEIPHIGIDSYFGLFGSSTKCVLRHSYDHIYYVTACPIPFVKRKYRRADTAFKGFERRR
ncbi:MAG: hypothetical protein ACLR23_02560, partial [Clostridia bacterium]